MIRSKRRSRYSGAVRSGINMEDKELELTNTEGQEPSTEGPDALHSVTALSGMYKDWFLEYASYVILERAVPTLMTG